MARDAVVHVRISDAPWFTAYAVAVLDLLLEIEREDVLVTDEAKRLASEVRRLSRGIYEGAT